MHTGDTNELENQDEDIQSRVDHFTAQNEAVYEQINLRSDLKDSHYA